MIRNGAKTISLQMLFGRLNNYLYYLYIVLLYTAIIIIQLKLSMISHDHTLLFLCDITPS